MSNKIKNYYPSLRFPEFYKTKDWSILPISNFLEESKIEGSRGNTAKKITVKLWGKGVTKKSENYHGSIATQYFKRKSGQFIYSKLDFLNQAFGIIPDELDGFESTIDLPCFDFKGNIVPLFFLKYVMRPIFYKKNGEVADGGRKAKRIQQSIFLNFPIAVPELPEQQKIADCLSSLDELIEAHEQKLDALKQHKKGLMQRLFPAEGETTPRWRFPEFRNAGKWTIKKLGAIANNLDHKRIPISANKRAKGNIPYYGASGIVDYINDFIFNQNLLCISEDGANLISRVTPIAFSISGKSWVNNHAHVLEFNTFECQKFIENYINSINIEEFLTGMAQPKLNKSKLDSIPIPLPNSSVEQQKITDFFTSINECIELQKEKLLILQNHKQGMMYQLFPH